MKKSKPEKEESATILLKDSTSKKWDEEIRKYLYTEKELQKIQCGLAGITPQWLQIFASKEALVLMFTLASIVQGLFFTYTASVISTIEKRFKLTSIHTGIMLAGNDISAVLFASFLGYYLNGRHRSRWLGLGILLTAASSFMSALPHFIYGPGDVADLELGLQEMVLNSTAGSDDSDKNLCFSSIEESCTADGIGESYIGPVVMLFISQFVSGISMSIFFSIGIPFIDDNVSKKNTSIYYSFVLLLKVLGPVFGYIVGGKCLEYWIIPSKSVNLTSKDPRWLGAWWLGFLFIGGGLVVLGFIFSLFPFKLPETLEREMKRIQKQVAKEEQLGNPISPEYIASLMECRKSKTTKPSLKNMIKLTRKLFSNKVWAASIFNMTVAILAIHGYKVFKPKYLEYQFRQSASEASYYVGMASLIATSLGTVISAVILRWLRPGPRFVTGYNIFVTFFACVCYLLMMLTGCSPLNVIGPSANGTGSGLECSADCSCSVQFLPVCAEDNSTLYYSPCYAGCTVANTLDGTKIYSECACIANTSGLLSADQAISTSVAQMDISQSQYRGTATRGYCPEPCNAFIYYIVLEILTITIFATGRIGSVIIQLRAVADEDKGLSIGIIEVVFALFGFIPAPLIMGWIIDSSCVLWQETCGVQGNCLLYDTDYFRILLHVVVAVLLLISVLGDFVMFKYANCLDLYGEKEADVPYLTVKDSHSKAKEEELHVNQES